MKVTRAMIVHQGRLMARTIRHLARQPSAGRDVGRLAATRGRSTMELRLPWLPFQLIDELAQTVRPGTKVFEYGGGGSTLWLLDRGAYVVTVEHDPGWAEHLRSSVTSSRWTLLEPGEANAYESYVSAIDIYDDDSFDVVVVDGRERARCVAAARTKVRPGGILIVDDADRERYQDAINSLGWPCEVVVGFAPAKPTLAYSAVLRRPPGHG